MPKQASNIFMEQGSARLVTRPPEIWQGLRRNIRPPIWKRQFLYPSHDSVTATVTLNSGKQFHGKLLHLDAFYVAILDQDGWYRSWSLQQAKVQVHDPLAEHLELLRKYTDKDIHDVFAYLETLK